MKLFKILPAAAGIIALTATVSFARDMNEKEEDGACRTVIVIRDDAKLQEKESSEHQPDADSSGGDNNVYRVKVMRGELVRLIAIDAYTGLILSNQEGSLQIS